MGKTVFVKHSKENKILAKTKTTESTLKRITVELVLFLAFEQVLHDIWTVY